MSRARTGAEPDARPDTALRSALLGRDHHDPGADHPRRLPARRLRRARRRRSGGRSRGLWRRPDRGRLDPRRCRELPFPWRHAHADDGVARLGRGQCGAQVRAGHPFGVMGLALATALGASLNLATLIWIATGGAGSRPTGRCCARHRRRARRDRLALALLLVATAGPLAQDAGRRALRAGDPARCCMGSAARSSMADHPCRDALRGAGAAALTARDRHHRRRAAGLIAAEHLAGPRPSGDDPRPDAIARAQVPARGPRRAEPHAWRAAGGLHRALSGGRTGACADDPCLPPDALRDWSQGLGEETFVGSSGRVFPRSFKASPLLRAWLRRLGSGAFGFRQATCGRAGRTRRTRLCDGRGAVFGGCRRCPAGAGRRELAAPRLRWRLGAPPAGSRRRDRAAQALQCRVEIPGPRCCAVASRARR